MFLVGLLSWELSLLGLLAISLNILSISYCDAQDVSLPSPLGDTIPVSIEITQAKQYFDHWLVPSKTFLDILAKHDQKYDNASHYDWFTKDGPLKEKSKQLHFMFPNSNIDDYLEVHVSNNYTNSTGQAKLDFTLKEPVTVADPVGKLFLERGELLNITVHYSGSPPFHYCYKICSPRDFIPCDVCFPYFQTADSALHIEHYLRYVGNYTLMFDINNIMREDTKHYTIKINDILRESNLPIAPIVSSILAVCILITGVALHMKFRHTSYETETADFDFVRVDDEEEWEQEYSFIQRVRYLLLREDPVDYTDENQYLLATNQQAAMYTHKRTESTSNGPILNPSLGDNETTNSTKR